MVSINQHNKKAKGVLYRASFMLYLIMGISKRRRAEYMQDMAAIMDAKREGRAEGRAEGIDNLSKLIKEGP